VIYLDTSALIKRFVNEKGSAVVQSIVLRRGPVATAKLPMLKSFAGLTRRLREGSVSRSDYNLSCRQLNAIDPHISESTSRINSILLLACDLIQRQPLRGFDAVHLASAVSLKSALGKEIIFAAADERLLRAAQAEELEVVNVETARAF
jgi:uncharacterized protein